MAIGQQVFTLGTVTERIVAPSVDVLRLANLSWLPLEELR